MNEMSRIACDPHAEELDRIRLAFDAALATPGIAALDAVRFELRIASSGLEAARSYAAALAGTNATAADLADAAAACEAAEREAGAVRAKLNAAVAEVAPAVRSGIGEPVDALQRIALDLLAQLERALDPLSEVQANLRGHGLPLCPAVLTAAPALHHLREMRRLLSRANTAQRVLNSAEAITP